MSDLQAMLLAAFLVGFGFGVAAMRGVVFLAERRTSQKQRSAWHDHR